MASREGLIRYQDNSFVRIPGNEDRIDKILVGPGGSVWTLPSGDAYAVWTAETGWQTYEERYPFSFQDFVGVGLTSDTAFWSTRHALYRDDRRADTAEIISFADLGFEGGNPLVRQMLVDQQDRIWLGWRF